VAVVNVVPTLATKRIGHQLIRDTRRVGADATVQWLQRVAPTQVPALVAMLAQEIAVRPKRSPSKRDQMAARGAARRARIAKEEAEWTQERARRGHARYIAGARDDETRTAERVYQRRAAKRYRDQRRNGAA
jgi:hypothetical protein